MEYDNFQNKTARQTQFLAAYAESANKVTAAQVSGVPISTVHRWFTEEDFQTRVRESFSRFETPLMEAAIQRALDKSDLLLMFLLKAANPERFDDGVRRQKLINTVAEENIWTLLMRSGSAMPTLPNWDPLREVLA